jgi:hypothetical protein
MNNDVAIKMYKEQVTKAKEELSDELFLGFYKVGQLSSEDMSKDNWYIYLDAIKEMELDESFGNCEKIYAKNIIKIRADIEKILEDWTIDIVSLEVGSFIYSLEISEMRGHDFYQIHKWKITGIREYTRSMHGTRKIFEVSEVDYGSICIGESSPEDDYHIEWCFTDDEVLGNMRESDTHFVKLKDDYESTDEGYLEYSKQFKEMMNCLDTIDEL